MKINLNNSSIKNYEYKNKKKNIEDKFSKITKEISSKKMSLIYQVRVK